MKGCNRYFFAIIIAVILLISMGGCKNNSSVPQQKPDTEGSTLPEYTGAEANKTFSKQFPQAEDVTWDSLDIGSVANFFDGKNNCKAFYDTKGHFQYVTALLDFESLPTAIQTFIKNKYKTTTVAIAQQIDDGKSKSYQIEIESDTDYIALEFDGKGKFLKEIKQPLSPEELQRQEEEGVDENEK
jgi:hypothetical protein